MTATNSSTGETVQVDASTGDMEFEFTSNLLGCLSHKPFSQGEGEPAYTLEYFLKDGSRFTIGINETSVFYQGASHARRTSLSSPWKTCCSNKREFARKKEDRSPGPLFVLRCFARGLPTQDHRFQTALCPKRGPQACFPRKWSGAQPQCAAMVQRHAISRWPRPSHPA